MNIIDLETPHNTEKYSAPKTDNEYPFYIPEYGKTLAGIPCYQLRISSPVSCIQYVISGSGVVISGDRIFTVNQGDSFLLLEGQNQIYYSNPDNQFERIWINFKGPLSLALIEIYGLKDTVVFKNTDSLRILEAIQQACRQTQDPEEYKNTTSQLFLKLIQFFAANKENAAAVTDPVEEIRLFLDLHIMENLKLCDIAAHFSFSKEHIIRVFKQTYGITPHQYILQSRIRIAMIMLRSTDDPISTISEKLKFSDPHHFSEVFKNHAGLRPSAYRTAFKKQKEMPRCNF